jgi:CBS domain-containing protein
MSTLSHAPTAVDPDLATTLRGTVADLLEAKGTLVHAVGPTEMVLAAITRMTACRVGALVVMEGPALVGIISERDYTRKGILQGHAAKDTPVAELMSSPVVTVSPDTSLGECLKVVVRHHIRHLPVVQDEKVVGVLSIGDLVGAVVAQQAETIQSLKSFIGADYPS